MKPTYRAIQIMVPGTLELVERATPAPGAGQVLIAVEACGVCGADAADIDRCMRSGDVKFRMVLSMKETVHAHQ
ncbi:hypothetical protein AU467_15465 [Mesorhizobium loti]|uniref:Alcohol dehydrogenase n=1 Tax=Rhizobium loti TaxID=381 RepID=A0A101KVJ7_RHILI|nr:hypothetical protein AU467_15465 [Mesorhizobium loti]